VLVGWAEGRVARRAGRRVFVSAAARARVVERRGEGVWREVGSERERVRGVRRGRKRLMVVYEGGVSLGGGLAK
jgi:hypothetical protein